MTNGIKTKVGIIASTKENKLETLNVLNTIHFNQRLLPNCLPHDLEIVSVNEQESTSQYHTPLAVAKFTGKRKQIVLLFYSHTT